MCKPKQPNAAVARAVIETRKSALGDSTAKKNLTASARNETNIKTYKEKRSVS